LLVLLVLLVLVLVLLLVLLLVLVLLVLLVLRGETSPLERQGRVLPSLCRSRIPARLRRGWAWVCVKRGREKHCWPR
jgi:hypothetical protein